MIDHGSCAVAPPSGPDKCDVLAAQVGCDPVVSVVCPDQCGPGAPALRRLKTAGEYKELLAPSRRLSPTVPIYGTYDPTNYSTCAPVQDVDVATSGQTWFDLHEWMQPVDVTVRLHC